MIKEDYIYYSPRIESIKCLNTIYCLDRDVDIDMNYFISKVNENMFCVPLISYCGKLYLTFDNTIKDSRTFEEFNRKIYIDWIKHSPKPEFPAKTFFAFFVKGKKNDDTSFLNKFLKLDDGYVYGVLDDLTVFSEGFKYLNNNDITF